MFTDNLTGQIIKKRAVQNSSCFIFFLFDDTSSAFFYDILESFFGLFTYILGAISNRDLCTEKQNRLSQRMTEHVNPGEMVNIMMAYCT